MKFEDRADIRSSFTAHFMSELCKIMRHWPLTSEREDGVAILHLPWIPAEKFKLMLRSSVSSLDTSVWPGFTLHGGAFIGVDSFSGLGAEVFRKKF